jgi:hypothetical protein
MIFLLKQMKMKKIILVLGVIIFAACNNSNTATDAKQDTAQIQIVGNDKDEHNCKGSAGYNWSIVKNNCIRIFEDGIRLNAIAKGIDTTTSAFAVFASDSNDAKAEIFLPTKNESIILQKIEKESAGAWKNDSFELKQWKGMYMLNDAKGNTLYQGMGIK